MARILLVEDEESSVRALEHFLERAGHEVACAASTREAIARGEEISPQLLLTDLHLADHEGGATVARELTARDPHLQVIVMTGQPEMEAERQLDGMPIFHIFFKPLRLAELGATVEAALAASRANS